MKRKSLLLFLMITLFVCVLAISASASNYDTSRKVTLDNGTECALYDAGGNALTYYLEGSELKSIKTADILSVGSATIDEKSYTTFNFKTVSPSNIVVVNFQDEKLGDLQVFTAKFQDSTVLEYCYMPSCLERLSQNYDSANVFRKTTKLKYVDFPIDCELNFIGKYSFSYATALKEIYIPANVTTFPEGFGYDWGCFVSCTSLTKVTFAENSMLETVPTYTFAHCTSLKEITLPDSVKTVGAYAFRATGIINSPFTPNSQCEYIDKWAFAYCSSLQNINIPKNATYNTKDKAEGVGLFQECTSLTTVNFHPNTVNTVYPAYMFNGCTALTYIKLPNTVTELPVRMFNNCSKLETIVFGANVVGMNALRSYSDHNSFAYGCSSLKYVYLPKTLTIDAENHSNACHVFFTDGNITFYFDGDYEEAVALQNAFKTNVTSCGNNGKITGAEIISLEEYGKLAKIEKCYLVWGGNTCDMFYDNVHEADNNPCVINCDRCATYGKAEENPVHNEKVTITYVSYDKEGVKLISCTNEGCKHSAEYAAEALFNCLGYSSAQNRNDGIVIGFLINENAISAYEEAGNEIKYGAFAVLNSNIGTNDVAGPNASQDSGVISVDLTDFGLYAFDLKIVGFTTEEHKKLEIAMGAYVITTTEGTTTVSYIQHGSPKEGNKYSTVTFNDIV